MSTSATETDSVQLFFLHAGNVLREGRFILQSLPNAEDGSVERMVRQLQAIHSILEQLDDPWTTQEEIARLISLVLEVASPLQEWLNRPRTRYQPPHQPTSGPQGRGRPRFIIDLDRAIELHDMELSWDQIARAMGVSRRTLYYHLEASGKGTARRPFTDISDENLDTLVADISARHPLSGSVIVRGHLESMDVHVPSIRVEKSLRRVDSIGVELRWGGAIRRRVYKVQGSNALWHHDGNEKLRPWGFYVHGCVDGHSRLIIYLKCSNNKKARTVENFFMAAIAIYGWPSRIRGDFGTENNGVERRMIERWGELHRAYLRGRSIHNVRIERLWRDVRRDTLEVFRTLFMYLEEIGLLDMESAIHRVCLFLTFHQRIQNSLDETVASWNLHKVRTAGNKTPLALYQISREQAINQGYWTGDPGDPLEEINAEYGVDGEESFPPADELEHDPTQPNYEEFPSRNAERDAGIFLNDDEEIDAARAALEGMNFEFDDGNFGIDVYCEAITRLTAISMAADSDSNVDK